MQAAQDAAHLRADGHGLLYDLMAFVVFGPGEDGQPGLRQVGQDDFGQADFGGDFQRQVRPGEIPSGARQRVQALRRQFHLFVGQKAAYQLCTRVGLFAVFRFGSARQQQPRFDFNQHRRHQQVFRRQIKLLRLDLGDVVQVLLGDFNHRDIQHVDILLADEVEQQVQRPLETAQDDFQRVRRDKQILRQVGYGPAEHPGDGLCILCGRSGKRRGVIHGLIA